MQKFETTRLGFYYDCLSLLSERFTLSVWSQIPINNCEKWTSNNIIPFNFILQSQPSRPYPRSSPYVVPVTPDPSRSGLYIVSARPDPEESNVTTTKACIFSTIVFFFFCPPLGLIACCCLCLSPKCAIITDMLGLVIGLAFYGFLSWRYLIEQKPVKLPWFTI